MRSAESMVCAARIGAEDRSRRQLAARAWTARSACSGDGIGKRGEHRIDGRGTEITERHPAEHPQGEICRMACISGRWDANLGAGERNLCALVDKKAQTGKIVQ